jgi:hypothetical protein
MFGSGYENCPEFGVLGGVIFKLDIGYQTSCTLPDYCASDFLQIYPCIGFRCIISDARNLSH